MDNELLQMFFPEGLLDYFKVMNWEHKANEYIFYLEEKNLAPTGYSKEEIESKGFYEEEKVNDFPLRGKQCLYRIRRRKWVIKDNGKIIQRDWDLLANGTRMTKEFAIFLKELNRYYTN